MYSDTVLMAAKSSRTMKLSMSKEATIRNKGTEFKSFLDESLSDNRHMVGQGVKEKFDNKIQEVKDKKTSNIPVTQEEDEKKNMQDNEAIDKFQHLIAIIDLLETINQNPELRDKLVVELEGSLDMAIKLSSKEGYGEEVSQKAIDRIFDLLSSIQNEGLNSVKINQIKTEIESVLKLSTDLPKHQPLYINQSGDSDSVATSKTGNQESSKGLELKELGLEPDELQSVEDEDSKPHLQLDIKKENQKQENEGRTPLSKDLFTEVETKTNSITLNSTADIISEEKFTFEGNKPINTFASEFKQELPIQKQIFSSVLEQVDKAHINVRENDSEMLLQLKPDNLGSLSLKIAIEKGIVVAKIIAENQIVKETLETNFNLLRDALNDKGFGVQELSVSVGQDSDFKNKNSFEQFKRFKNRKIQNDLMVKKGSSLNNLERMSSNMVSSSIDFLA